MAAPGQSASQAPEIIRVDVMVQDISGNPVTGLAVEDFALWSEGQRLPIEIFQSPTDATPLTLVVLVDITASQLTCDLKVLPEPVVKTAGRGIPMAAATTADMGVWGWLPLNGFRRADRVQVGSAGRRLTLSGRFTSDVGEIIKDWRSLLAVPPVEGLGPSAIWDAVNDTVAVLAHAAGRRAIVLVTDGQATGNVQGQLEVSTRAALAGVSVSMVAEESMLPTYPLMTTMASHGIDPTRALTAMADVTGGSFGLARAEVANPESRCFTRDPEPIFRLVLEQLHQAYILGFVPQIRDGKPHNLDVRVSKPGIVRARKTY